jgi:hypothetical protein
MTTNAGWKWVDYDDTRCELIPADCEAVGDADSILYHDADWSIKAEHKALIAAAPDLLAAYELAAGRFATRMDHDSQHVLGVLRAALAKAGGEARTRGPYPAEN